MTAQINDVIKSFDFPNEVDYYMVGIVTRIDDDMITCKTIKIVQDGKTVDFGARFPDTFSTPMQGCMMFDDRFQRIVVLA